jgi:phosphoribosylformimino-5-aminoimidazole carboxamide ribotide isomerase
MIFIPAIDIRGGKAVRLEQGHFEKETVYDEDPLEAARKWIDDGARQLHVVDLDGAREGHPVNLDQLERIATLDVPVQYGGGLRSLRSAREALAAGASRVVLGTAAYSDVEFLDAVLETWPVRVVVAVDVRGGHVSVAGWTKATQMLPVDVVERLQRRGVKQFVYTNVDRDGMLNGPDLEEVRAMSEAIRGRFLYSGGISSLDDLRALKELRLVNLAGVISGKAVYEGRFTIAEAHAVLDEERQRGERARVA